MKLKILKNVIVGQKVHKKDQIVDVDRKTAGVLVEGQFAQEHAEGPKQQQQQQES